MIGNKISHKLLSFWLGSIVLSVLMLGIVFIYLDGEVHKNTIKRQMNESFEYLKGRVDARTDRLLRDAEYLAKRQDIVASLNMIHNYQDLSAYQAIVFDSEKIKIARELSKLLQSENVDVITAHDGKGNLAGFLLYDENKNESIIDGTYR